MVEITRLGKVEHEKEIMGDGDLQVDTLAVHIPLECLTDEGCRLLDYWGVEDFDRGYIDWKNGVIILEYTTEHYLPKGYVPEEDDCPF